MQTICCFKRYAHNEIKQHKKHTFQELKVTRLLLDREITKINLRLLCFLSQVACLCNLLIFIIKIRCRDPWYWIVFLRKKRSQPNICEEEMEDREKQLLEAVHTIAKTRKNFPRHFPSCSLMRLLSINNFCSVCPEFPSLA